MPWQSAESGIPPTVLTTRSRASHKAEPDQAKIAGLISTLQEPRFGGVFFRLSNNLFDFMAYNKYPMYKQFHYGQRRRSKKNGAPGSASGKKANG